MTILSRLLALASCSALLGSCGNSESEAAAPTEAPQEGFKQKSGDLFDDDSDKIVGRFAATNPTYNADGSQIAGEAGTRQNQQFQGEFGKKEFAAGNYKKKAFWGQKDYASKVYSGNLDGSRYQTRSALGAKGAREETKMARDSGRNYQTGTASSGPAREASSGPVQAGSDSTVDSRRRSYKQPDIIDWKTQQTLTVEDTNEMLGR